jgi:hypothetical protein
VSSERGKRSLVGALAAVAAAVGIVLVPTPQAAVAQDPVQQAAELAKQASELTKQYNDAKAQLDARRGELAVAQAEFQAATVVADQARARQGEFYGQVDKLTAASFQGARFNNLAALLVSESPQDFLDQMSALDLIAADNQQALGALRAVVDETEVAESAATAAANRATTAEAQASAIEAGLGQQLKDLKAKQLELTGKLDRLGAAERDRLSGYANGRIPASALCRAGGDGPLLQCGAAKAYEAMDAAFAAVNGRNLCGGGGYRSYEEQVRLHAAKPGMTAQPGTSNHGWGLAVDMCAPGGGTLSFGSADYAWMADNASAFGWVNPPWALPGQGREEPWHWEYTG